MKKIALNFVSKASFCQTLYIFLQNNTREPKNYGSIERVHLSIQRFQFIFFFTFKFYSAFTFVLTTVFSSINNDEIIK